MKQILVTFMNINQPGHKNRIAPHRIDYSKSIENKERMGIHYVQRHYSSLENVIKQTDFIFVNTNMCQRDKLLISYTLLRCIVNKGIIAVPLCFFETNKFVISQNPMQALIEGKGKKLIDLLKEVKKNRLKTVRKKASFIKNLSVHIREEMIVEQNR